MIGTVNGLVGIRLMHQLTGPMGSGYSAAALLVTDTVGSRVDGSVREWQDARRMFDRMKRWLRRGEAARAIFMSANGAEAITTRGVSTEVAKAVAGGDLRLYQHRIEPLPPKT